MDEQLTFKDYLHSKNQLREAVAKTPRRSATYSVKKYCKLTIGESKSTKEHVNLKPNQQIIVDWLYEDVDNPTVLSAKFICINKILAETEHSIFWEGIRLLKWLSRNTREEF